MIIAETQHIKVKSANSKNVLPLPDKKATEKLNYKLFKRKNRLRS